MAGRLSWDAYGGVWSLDDVVADSTWMPTLLQQVEYAASADFYACVEDRSLPSGTPIEWKLDEITNPLIGGANGITVLCAFAVISLSGSAVELQRHPTAATPPWWTAMPPIGTSLLVPAYGMFAWAHADGAACAGSRLYACSTSGTSTVRVVMMGRYVGS